MTGKIRDKTTASAQVLKGNSLFDAGRVAKNW
jgi:hypothetical protein